MPRAALTQPRVVIGLMFFPRGGSAQVARGLAHVLAGLRWEVTIVSGSLRLPGRPGDAHRFFSGLDVSPIDYTAALSAADPLRADSPLHPSYEDRPGAPDLSLVGFFIKPPPAPDEPWTWCSSFWEPMAWLATVPARSGPTPAHHRGSTCRQS